MSATLPIDDATILRVLDYLDRIDREARERIKGSRRPVLTAIEGEAALLHAELLDSVLATFTPAQRRLLDRWRGYVCPKCGERMVTGGRSLAERFAEQE